MAGGGASNKSSNGGGPTRVRKRVEIESASANANAATTNANLKRAKDGSAFARWYAFFLFVAIYYMALLFVEVGLDVCGYVRIV